MNWFFYGAMSVMIVVLSMLSLNHSVSMRECQKVQSFDECAYALR